MLIPIYGESVLFELAARALQTDTIAIDTAVTLGSSDITSAITSFFGIGAVLGVLALVLGLRFIGPIGSALRGLAARR